MKKHLKNEGSILIWTVLLGFVMTSVFFFFSVRQRATVQIQRNTAEIVNTRSYLASYAEYLKSNASEIAEGTVFDGNINVHLTQSVDEILGFVDSGFSEIDTYNFASDNIIIEWNRCDNPPNPLGDLIVYDGPTAIHTTSNPCTINEYADIAGPLSVANPFLIGTLNNPFFYRITGDNLIDEKWHLELSTTLDYGKEIRHSEVFQP